MPSSPTLGSLIFIRLFRLWAAARAEQENPLPHMQDASWLYASAPELAVACASLFDLVEAHLHRPLVPECLSLIHIPSPRDMRRSRMPSSA